MHLVNCSQKLFDGPVSSTAGAEKANLSWVKSSLLPGGVLLAAILASTVLGSHIKSPDELAWLTRLANQDDPGAQLQLGLAYREGRYGLTPDPKTGLHWLQRSAAAGNAYAEDELGKAYAAGQGTTKDTAKAEQWWRKAIDDGDREARIHLADTLIRNGHIDEGNALLF